MKAFLRDTPRVFNVGIDNDILLKDCGSIKLENNEQISISTYDGLEYEVVRKSWGFYAAPSLNSRLNNLGLRAVIVKTTIEKFFIFFVESGQEDNFYSYIVDQKYSIVSWIDNDASLKNLEDKLLESKR
jgi:hypothetical protein